MTFFGPIYALLNLFIYILQNPDHPNVNSDVALMDIGAGHFARLEFATDSQISVPFAKEVAALARDVVSRAKVDSLKNPKEAMNTTPGNVKSTLPTPEAADPMIYDMPPEDVDRFNSNWDVSYSFLDRFLPLSLSANLSCNCCHCSLLTICVRLRSSCTTLSISS